MLGVGAEMGCEKKSFKTGDVEGAEGKSATPTRGLASHTQAHGQSTTPIPVSSISILPRESYPFSENLISELAYASMFQRLEMGP